MPSFTNLVFEPIIAPHWFSNGIVELDFTKKHDDPNNYASNLLKKHQARLAIGKYGEERVIYDFEQYLEKNNKVEPRTVHLGIDLNLPPGEPIYAPLDSTVHSFKNNNSFGDYGPTVILEHEVNKNIFYTLYGHLSKNSLKILKIHQTFKAGEKFAQVGDKSENGGWVPHLHFQIILDINFENKKYFGDFPGVCSKNDFEKFSRICPDPTPFILPNTI